MSSTTATGATSWAALFRVSLRELLLLIAMIAFAIVSMKYASTAWRTCVYTITMAIFMWAAVIGVIDRGPRQAFAIGLFLLMTIYGVVIVNSPRSSDANLEMFPERARLPKSRAVKHLFTPLETVEWVDRETDQVLPNYDPANPPPGVRAFSRIRTTPQPTVLMAVAHCWWALLLGYIGGRFARVVYLRRSRAPEGTD